MVARGVPEEIMARAEEYGNKLEPPFNKDDIYNAYSVGAMDEKEVIFEGSVDVDNGYCLNSPQRDKNLTGYDEYYRTILLHKNKIPVESGDKIKIIALKK